MAACEPEPATINGNSSSTIIWFGKGCKRVGGEGTKSGKGTKSVDLADFLTEIGVPDKDVVRMFGNAHLQKYRVSTLRDNYSGLVATLGADGGCAGRNSQKLQFADLATRYNLWCPLGMGEHSRC